LTSISPTNFFEEANFLHYLKEYYIARKPGFQPQLFFSSSSNFGHEVTKSRRKRWRPFCPALYIAVISMKNRCLLVINPLSSMTKLCHFVIDALASTTNQCHFVIDALALTTNQCHFVIDALTLTTNQCRFVNKALALTTNQCHFVIDALALTTN
jgi:hypothetical protein